MPTISVIIPAINEANNIQRAIESAWQAGANEVIVVDGGSQDETLQLARHARAITIDSPAGRAIQQNAGAKRATGDILLFQHADTWLGTDSLAQIRATVDVETICGAFQQRIDAEGIRFRLLEKGNDWRVRRLGVAFGDQGIFVRRDAFDEAGGFASVSLLEDVILMKQLRNRQKPILLPGPIYISSRRWQKHGILRQTFRNWSILAAYRFGVSPDRLARYYTRHDS